MPPTTVPTAVEQPTNILTASTNPQALWWCRGPQPITFTLGGYSQTASVKSGLITSPYATVEDVFAISIADNQQFDYDRAKIATWLSIGAAKINEWLGQRFNVPLTVWSSTVVWANSELAYIGATRQRGINSEALVADFRARDEAVMSWLQRSRDHEITPDPRLSIESQPQQALQYFAQPARGWDAGRGAVGVLGGPYSGLPGSIGRVR